MNTLSYKEIDELAVATDRIKNKGLSVQSIMSLLKLKARLKRHLEDVKQFQLAVMDKYGVSEEQGTYNYTKHPEITKIVQDLTGIVTNKVEVEPLNFMNETEFVAATADFSADIMTILYQRLVKLE